MHEFAATFLPGVEDRLEYYKRRRPIFDLHGIEDEIRKALDRNIPLEIRWLRDFRPDGGDDDH